MAKSKVESGAMKLDYKKTILTGFGFLATSIAWAIYDPYITKILNKLLTANATITAWSDYLVEKLPILADLAAAQGEDVVLAGGGFTLVPLFIGIIMTFDNIQDFLHHFIDENYKYDILYLSDGALYKELYNEGIILAQPSLEYEFTDNYAHVAITGSSKNPDKVLEKIYKEAFNNDERSYIVGDISLLSHVQLINYMFLKEKRICGYNKKRKNINIRRI